MVRLIIIMIFANLSFACIGQKKDIELKASFCRDSVFVNESLELILCFKNNSNKSFKLYPKAFTAMMHYSEYFITYESIDRMIYILNDIRDYNSVILLNPQEEFIYKYEIKADSKFFYKGKNEVFVFYRLFGTSWNDKKQREYDKGRRKKDKEEDLLLSSSVIEIKIYLAEN